MPHITVKCYPGRTEEQKQLLAERIQKDVVEIMNTAAENVSVSIIDVDPEKWQSDVVEAEILPGKETLYVKPGYLQENPEAASEVDDKETQEDDYREYVTFRVTTSEGSEVELAVVDEFQYENKNYVAASIVIDDEIDNDAVFIYRVRMVDEEYKFEKITNKFEYEKVTQAYMEIMEA